MRIIDKKTIDRIKEMGFENYIYIYLLKKAMRDKIMTVILLFLGACFCIAVGGWLVIAEDQGYGYRFVGIILLIVGLLFLVISVACIFIKIILIHTKRNSISVTAIIGACCIL